MKTIKWLAAAAIACGMAFSADYKGYIIDQSCAGDASMKGNEACARKCIRKGSPAVLLTPEAKVYKLDDQAKVVEHAGHKVIVSGTLDGDTIKVESIKIDAGCVLGPTGCQ
jgi:hypothetical protein